MLKSNGVTRLRMTASEIAMGRYMRAPDHTANQGADQGADDFAAFAAAGEVEVGDSNAAEPADPKPKPKSRRNPPKPAEKPEPAAAGEADDGDDGDDDTEFDDLGDDGDDGDADGDTKPKKSPKDHQVERLKREKADLARQLRETEKRQLEIMAERLEAIENRLQGGKAGDNQSTGTPEPDVSDTDKYPLGHLDDRYIEDKLEWLAEKKASERADAVLQRQQEIEQTEQQQQMQTELLDKVDDLATRGSELYDDFQETVVEAGMRGDWDLQQATFEACHEADNGEQILYALSQDTKEAARVAKLSPYQQMKYVQEKDAEISKGKSPRRIPRAPEPPVNPARGANSRTRINPATDNLDDFEKAWEADARKKR